MTDEKERIKDKFNDRFKNEIRICSTESDLLQKMLEKYQKNQEKKNK